MALSEKYKRFADDYLVDMNGTRAYKATYPSVKSDSVAAANASRLLRNAKIAAYLAERQQVFQENTGIKVERVLQEYARLAFFDPRKPFDDNGKPKDISALDDDTAAALVGLDVAEEYEGVGEERKFVGYTKKYKLANKLGALDSLGKHLGMFDGKGGQDPAKTNNLLTAIERSTEEDIDGDDLPEVQ